MPYKTKKLFKNHVNNILKDHVTIQEETDLVTVNRFELSEKIKDIQSIIELFTGGYKPLDPAYKTIGEYHRMLSSKLDRYSEELQNIISYTGG
jgi:hypothetical protein